MAARSTWRWPAKLKALARSTNRDCASREASALTFAVRCHPATGAILGAGVAGAFSEVAVAAPTSPLSSLSDRVVGRPT
jgi:hypothetical protein